MQIVKHWRREGRVVVRCVYIVLSQKWDVCWISMWATVRPGDYKLGAWETKCNKMFEWEFESLSLGKDFSRLSLFPLSLSPFLKKGTHKKFADTLCALLSLYPLVEDRLFDNIGHICQGAHGARMRNPQHVYI